MYLFIFFNARIFVLFTCLDLMDNPEQYPAQIRA